MKVAILCGGLGTRMREETEFRPKPLVPVGGKPILWHIMKAYAHYGFREFVLCLGYRGDLIKDYFLNYEAMANDFTIRLGKQHHIEYHAEHLEQNFAVTLAETGQETATGGRIRRAAKYFDGDTFMVTYGDGLSDVNIAAVLAFHKQHGRLATITTVRPISRYGMLDIQADQEVRAFNEKPRGESWANAGFFVFNRKVLDYIPADDCALEGLPLEKLAADGQLMAFRHDGFFFAMDTFREFKQINDMWDRGDAPWKVWSS